MKRINLHPQEKYIVSTVSKRISFAMGAAASVGLLSVVLGYGYYEMQIINQNSRATYLKGEIDGLDIQIKKIADVLERTEVLVARKKVVEKLQFNRGQAVNLLNEFAKLTPDGVQLKAVEQQKEALKITGWAFSNENIAQFMKQIESSNSFEPSKLIEVKAVDVQNKQAPSSRVQEFQISVKMIVEKKEEEKNTKGRKEYWNKLFQN